MSNYPNNPPPGGFGAGPGYPQPGPIPVKSGMGTGALIAIIVGVVLLVLVAIIGIMAVLGVYGTRKYIANAKTAEAKNSLGMMAKDAAAAYENEAMDDVLKPSSAAVPISHRLCPSASPVPISLAYVSGKKYQSSSSDWSGSEGWRCLKFEMTMPQYYQYNYTSTPDSFAGYAYGDLNANGVTSSFEIDGKVVDGSLRIAPTLMENNPEE